MEKKFLTADEAAEMFQISADDVRRWAVEGQLRPLIDMGTWKYRRDDIQQLVAAQGGASSVPDESGFGESPSSASTAKSRIPVPPPAAPIADDVSFLELDEEALAEAAEAHFASGLATPPSGTQRMDPSAAAAPPAAVPWADTSESSILIRPSGEASSSDSDIQLKGPAAASRPPALGNEPETMADQSVMRQLRSSDEIAEFVPSQSSHEMTSVPEALESISDGSMSDLGSIRLGDEKTHSPQAGGSDAGSGIRLDDDDLADSLQLDTETDSGIRLAEDSRVQSFASAEEAANASLTDSKLDSGLSLEAADSGLSLESSSVIGDDDSDLTAGGGDSGLALETADSGLSLEAADSGLSLDTGDSGLSLDAGDSGLSLDTGDSGLSLQEVDLTESRPVKAEATQRMEQSGAQTEELILDEEDDSTSTRRLSKEQQFADELDFVTSESGSGSQDAFVIGDDELADDATATIVKSGRTSSAEVDVDSEAFAAVDDEAELVSLDDEPADSDFADGDADYVEADEAAFSDDSLAGESSSEFMPAMIGAAAPADPGFGTPATALLGVCGLLIATTGWFVIEGVTSMWTGADLSGPAQSIVSSLAGLI